MKTILVDAVHSFISNDGEINQDMYDMLEQYENQKIILTNAPKENFAQLSLDVMPYPVFTLEKNPPKSNPEYYEKMLVNFNLTPNDAVCFEHKNENVTSAQSVGIPTHYYDMESKNLDALKNFIDATL